MTSETPDEVVTVYYCRGCEMLSLAGDVAIEGHVDRETGDQLACHRCGTRINAESFYDYANLEVADY